MKFTQVNVLGLKFDIIYFNLSFFAVKGLLIFFIAIPRIGFFQTVTTVIYTPPLSINMDVFH